MSRINTKNGFSLVEMLVVVTIFALLGILVSQSLAMSIRGSKKSEALDKTRSNLSYASGIMERQLRNADQINKSDEDNYCPNNQRVDYSDESGSPAYFACVVVGAETKIASGSAEGQVFLTGSDINLSNCSITCTPGEEGIPDSVEISFVGGVEGAQVSLQTKILLRNY